VGLPWVRLDTNFASNPKILELLAAKQFRAAFAYVAALAYAGSHGTDGYIQDTALPFIHATKTDAKQLVDVGLWVADPAGWHINGWDEFQVSDDAAKKRRERAQKGAAARWGNTKRDHLHGI